MSVMLSRGISAITALLLGSALLFGPAPATAQRHGGGGASSGGAGLWGYSRPDGVDDKDSLKDFHNALAVQATGPQITEFQALTKITEGAKAELETFMPQLGMPTSATDSTTRDAALDQSLENARAANKKFIAGFSEPQKSGLKEITKRLDKSDSDLEQEQAKLHQSLQSSAAAAAAAESSIHAQNLDKALAEFSSQQLALGREMGIVFANGQDLTFLLPAVKRPVTIENRSISVTVSGELSQVAAENGRRTFNLEMLADLSDFQQNIGTLLHAQLDSSNQCGERLTVRRAMLTPAEPSSHLMLQLHYERWSCRGAYGQTATELAESDGSVEIKLTPSVEKSNTLKLAAEFGRVDANGMFGDSLRSGDLGDDLRSKVSQSMLAALTAGANFNATLPPALENSAVVKTARFHDSGAGVLSVLFEGQTQISNEQANLLATQLNQALADKAATSQ
jgi:hypothetical protein